MILTSDMVDFRVKIITKDKKFHLTIMKRSINSRGHTIQKMYALDYRTSKHMNQRLTELEGEKDKSTILVGDFSTPLPKVHRISKYIEYIQHYHRN